jgi:hypothetical protein
MGWVMNATPETRYPFYSGLGDRQGRSGRVVKSRPPLGFDPRSVKPGGVAIPTEPSRTTQHGTALFHTLKVRCSGFRHFVTHFITIVSTFRDCFLKSVFCLKACSCFFILSVILCLYYRHFVRSWNQIGALRCKWVRGGCTRHNYLRMSEL